MNWDVPEQQQEQQVSSPKKDNQTTGNDPELPSIELVYGTWKDPFVVINKPSGTELGYRSFIIIIIIELLLRSYIYNHILLLIGSIGIPVEDPTDYQEAGDEDKTESHQVGNTIPNEKDNNNNSKNNNNSNSPKNTSNSSTEKTDTNDTTASTPPKDTVSRRIATILEKLSLSKDKSGQPRKIFFPHRIDKWTSGK